MGFWKPLRCQEAARMAEFPSFQFSAARRVLNWQVIVGNPWGGFRTAPAHVGHFWGSSGLDQFFLFRISYAHKTADCRPGSGAKTCLGYQKNFLLLH